MAEALKVAGNEQFKAKKYEQAIKTYGRALAARPSDEEAAMVLVNRSAAYTLLEKFEPAVADAQQAAVYRPGWAKAQVRLAEALSRKHAHHHALAAWKRAVEFADNDGDRARYQNLLAQAEQAVAKVRVKNAPAESMMQSVDSPEETWYAKITTAIRSGRARPSSMAGLALSRSVWELCDDAWQEIDKAVTLQPDGRGTANLYHTMALPRLIEPILTDSTGFHLDQTNGTKLVNKLTRLMDAEAAEGDFTKFFAGWSAERIIDDLDARIGTVGRTRVRRLAAAFISNRIITAFFALTSAEFGTAIECAKAALNLLEAGNRKWAHESCADKGYIFLRSKVRNARMTVMRYMLYANRSAQTSSARKAFPLEEMETWAKAVLDDKIPDEFWAEPGWEDPRYRMAYDALPRWEAYATLGLAQKVRVDVPFKEMPIGSVVFADVEAAKKGAELYDLSASLMPDDFHEKRTMLWSALYCHLRAGGLRVSAVRSKFAQAAHIDALIEPYFGPIESTFGEKTICQAHVKGLAHLPANLVTRPLPTVHCPSGTDPKSFVPKGFWDRYAGETEMLDVLVLP